jgi:hypothetical protein
MLENTQFAPLSSVEGRPILGQAVRIRDGAPESFLVWEVLGVAEIS